MAIPTGCFAIASCPLDWRKPKMSRDSAVYPQYYYRFRKHPVSAPHTKSHCCCVKAVAQHAANSRIRTTICSIDNGNWYQNRRGNCKKTFSSAFGAIKAQSGGASIPVNFVEIAKFEEPVAKLRLATSTELMNCALISPYATLERTASLRAQTKTVFYNYLLKFCNRLRPKNLLKIVFEKLQKRQSSINLLMGTALYEQHLNKRLFP
jgi:hypothetical protein